MPRAVGKPSQHPDVVIPLGSVESPAPRPRSPASAALSNWRTGIQVPSQPAGLRTERHRVPPALRGQSPSAASPLCSTPDRPGSAPGHPAAARRCSITPADQGRP